MQGVAILDAPGEHFNYTFQQRQRLIYLSVKRSRVPLIAGVSHTTLAGSLELAAEADPRRRRRTSISPPTFFPYAQPEVHAFLDEFARETGDAVPNPARTL